MINIEFGEVILVDAQLHLGLRITDALLDFMPSVVLKLNVVNLQGHVEERFDVPIVENVEKDGDGSETPEDHRHSDESVSPQGEVLVALLV